MNMQKFHKCNRLLGESRQKGKRVALGAYFNVLLQANPKTFQEILRMANGVLTIDDVLWEAGLIPKWLEAGEETGKEIGKEIAAKNLLTLGWSIEKAAEVSELDLEKVRLLYASMQGTKG
jgi:hypothetical protein